VVELIKVKEIMLTWVTKNRGIYSLKFKGILRSVKLKSNPKGDEKDINRKWKNHTKPTKVNNQKADEKLLRRNSAKECATVYLKLKT